MPAMRKVTFHCRDCNRKYSEMVGDVVIPMPWDGYCTICKVKRAALFIRKTIEDQL